VRRWTKPEDGHLQSWAGKKTYAAIAADLGRTVGQVSCRARRLGIVRKRPWTWGDLAYLRDQAGKIADREIAVALDRTEMAISKKVSALYSPRRGAGPAGRRDRAGPPLRRWAEWEEDYLRRHSAAQTNAEIAANLGRTAAAVAVRACRLGVVRSSSGGARPCLTPTP
jgi:hypothetical protein